MTREEFMKKHHHYSVSKWQAAFCCATNYNDKGGIDGQEVVVVNFKEFGFGVMLADQVDALGLDHMNKSNMMAKIQEWGP